MSGGDDWQAGDRGIIIREGLIRCADGRHTGDNSPPRGAVREVAMVHTSVFRSGEKCGCPELKFTDGNSAITQRVRKLRAHTLDAEDTETIKLLTGKPVKEPRHA